MLKKERRAFDLPKEEFWVKLELFDWERLKAEGGLLERDCWSRRKIEELPRRYKEGNDSRISKIGSGNEWADSFFKEFLSRN